MGVKVSVIVPVYNVEKYLLRCLQSIKGQTFTDFECICVDDGSTDASGKMLDDFAAGDGRFRVIHKKENGGIGRARNSGVLESTGDYVLHIDSDDYMEKDMIAALYNKAAQGDYDMVFCAFYHYDGHGGEKILFLRDDINYNDRDICIKTIAYDSNPGTVMSGNIIVQNWNRIVRRSIYDKVFFPDWVNTIADDIVINVQIRFYCKKIAYIDKPLYHYCSNDSSSIRDPRKHFKRQKGVTLDFMFIADFIQEYCKDNLQFFEPELSRKVVSFETLMLRCEDLRDEAVKAFKKHPAALNHIFDKAIPISFYNRILIFLAAHGITLPYKIMDILLPIEKRYKTS